MTRQVLFIQGRGAGAYDVDGKLVEALRNELGPEYELRYPRMPNESELDYKSWSRRIADELAGMRDGAILVGHSIGASIAIKWLTERKPEQSLAGVFLIATPFWGDSPPWQDVKRRTSRDAGYGGRERNLAALRLAWRRARVILRRARFAQNQRSTVDR